MKRKLYNSLALMLISIFALIGFTGCTKEYITDEYVTIKGAEASNYFFKVGYEGNNWVWNEETGRYECAFEFEELTNDIYNYGTMLANVFVEPGLEGEWLEMLPYTIQYYAKEGETVYYYSVDIKCAFQPGEVIFIFQPEDSQRVDDILEPFEFKVTLLFDQKNLPKD